MTRYEGLLDQLAASTITLVTDDSPCLPAASFRGEIGDYIFFNEEAFCTSIERFVALAHEKGHCDTGAFYNISTPLETRGRCETRAWRQAVLNELPFNQLLRAFEACTTMDGVELYDLAAHLGVTPEFIQRAVKLYACLGKQVLRSDDNIETQGGNDP